MGELTEAVQYEKLEILKRDLFLYIDENSDKIDTNLPVFFGHVIARLDDFPNIDDVAYDEFIDAVAFHALDASSKGGNLDFIEKLTSNAVRFKRRSKGKAILTILAGLKLMKVGKYRDAINAMAPYWKNDARIGFNIAFCHTRLADAERGLYTSGENLRPSENELAAREQLLEMVRIQPPMYRIRQLDIRDTAVMDQAFWKMIDRALEWFPEEQWFVRIGLQKAKKDKNEKMKGKLLKYASEQFYNDMFFLRELFNYRLENRDAAGASGVVKQMMQQHPEHLEPIFYGMKLGLLTTGKSSFMQYRDLAAKKQMPRHLLQLLDFTYLLMKGEEYAAAVELKDMKKRYSPLQYYITVLEYLTETMKSGDENLKKKAKKILIDSVDHYAQQTLKTRE